MAKRLSSNAKPDPHLADEAVTLQAPFRPTPPTTLIHSCADGRFAVEDAAALRALGITETPDRQTPPGGPAALHAMGCERHLDREIGFARLGFLLDHHHTTRVLLLTHEDCAHYKMRYPQDDAATRMHRQLVQATEVAAELRKRYPDIRVDCYYVRPERQYVTVRAITT